MSAVTTFCIAFLASFAPIFLWLWLLEHEDKHPEPLRLTIYAFIGGMLAVAAALPLEVFVLKTVGYNPIGVFLWAFIEEGLKLLAAACLVLYRTENDEPIDSMMYLIATALGFSTLENTLYLFHPLQIGSIASAFIISNYRFFGATILHTIASSVVGACLGLAYYKEPRLKKWYIVFGLIIATALHTAFNLSIIYLDDSRSTIAFYGVWILFVGVLLIFEKVKHVTNPHITN